MKNTGGEKMGVQNERMEEQWTAVIEPKTALLDIPVKELWQYRSMIFMLVKRNYQIQYKQTILGPLWIILNPIFSSGLFSLVFGYVGKFQSGNIPYFLFYMSANVLWSFFAGCVNGNTGIFSNNTQLFGKIYFPRLVVPVSQVLFELVRLLIQMMVFLVVWCVYLAQGETSFTGPYLLLVPFLVLEAGLLGMAMGMIVSSLTIRYRDLSHFMNFGMQLLMYASPVLYPISQLPDFLQKLVLLNPMASVVEAFRFCLTGSGMIHRGALLYSAAITGVILFLGMILFNQTEKNFIDVV
ncbi:MAG: ABC transporter permease [Lachnospiraceae bacterium]|nr:ABC transporter permease [Lachnospiraceae bacterium]